MAAGKDDFSAGQCSVCWELLCEPVLWPSCSHCFCLLCTLRLRRHPKPACPLCRALAPRCCKVAGLHVDRECVARVRRLVGFSVYESKRRELWCEAVRAPVELRSTPLFCMIMSAKKWREGTRLGVRFLEPRYQEVVKKAMAPGGNRRFAALSCPITRGSESEMEAGARVRLCELLESVEEEDGICYAIVETGPMCKVLEIAREAVPLAELEELDEQDEELDQDDTSDDDVRDDSIVISEERRLGILRERLYSLQALHATMRMEQARLEQRRLEFALLFSQRVLLQELIQMSSQLSQLADVAVRRAEDIAPLPAVGRHRVDHRGEVSRPSHSDAASPLLRSRIAAGEALVTPSGLLESPLNARSPVIGGTRRVPRAAVVGESWRVLPQSGTFRSSPSATPPLARTTSSNTRAAGARQHQRPMPRGP